MSARDATKGQFRLILLKNSKNRTSRFSGKKTIRSKSQMRSLVGRMERAHDWQNANLAEPHAAKILSASQAKNFVNQSQNWSLSTQSVLAKSRPANDRIGDARCAATKGELHSRANAASAIAANAKGRFVRTPVVRSGRSECRLLDTQASIRQSRLAWLSVPVPI